jgi:hypothetical protein
MKLHKLLIGSVISTGIFIVPFAFRGNTSAQPTSSTLNESLPSPVPTPAGSPSANSKKIVYAKPVDFFCQLRDQKDKSGNLIKRNVPTTIAQVGFAQALREINLFSSSNSIIKHNDREFQEVVVYHWTRNYPDTNETALMRCRRVASVLKDIKRQDDLNLIGVGEMNGEPAICLTSKRNGPCTRLIFSWKTQQATSDVLKDFLEAMKGLAIAEEEIIAVKSAHGEFRQGYKILKQRRDNVSPTRMGETGY